MPNDGLSCVCDQSAVKPCIRRERLSTFGDEFVAMKQATEYVQGLCHKLRMIGIIVDEPEL